MVKYIGFSNGQVYELFEAEGNKGLLVVPGFTQPCWCSFDCIMPL